MLDANARREKILSAKIARLVSGIVSISVIGLAAHSSAQGLFPTKRLPGTPQQALQEQRRQDQAQEFEKQRLAQEMEQQRQWLDEFGTLDEVEASPVPRDFLAATADFRGGVYAVGGGGWRLPSRLFERFEPLTRQWHLLTPLRIGRSNLAAATDARGAIYAIGGYIDTIIGKRGFPPDADLVTLTQLQCTKTVERYDPATNRWSLVAPLGVGRSDLAVATGKDGRIYALGGQFTVVTSYQPYNPVTKSGAKGSGSGQLTNAAEVYDPATNRWSAIASLPLARASLAAAADRQGRIYAIGGIDEHSNKEPSRRVERYDPAADRWIAVAPMPTARFGISAATGADGRIYVFGGGTVATGQYSNVVEAYDPETNKWTHEPPLVYSRHAMAAAASADGMLWIIGGERSRGTVSVVETRPTQK